MRLLFKNTDDSDKLSVIEVLAADQIKNMEELIIDGGADELSDLPGILFTCNAIESLPEGEVFYSTVFMVCRSEETVNEIMQDLAVDGYLNSTKYECMSIVDANPQEMYDLLKLAGEQWS